MFPINKSLTYILNMIVDLNQTFPHKNNKNLLYVENLRRKLQRNLYKL